MRFERERHLKRVEHHLRAATVALYGVGPGAVEPLGIGDGASLEPCVFDGFLCVEPLLVL